MLSSKLELAEEVLARLVFLRVYQGWFALVDGRIKNSTGSTGSLYEFGIMDALRQYARLAQLYHT